MRGGLLEHSPMTCHVFHTLLSDTGMIEVRGYIGCHTKGIEQTVAVSFGVYDMLPFLPESLYNVLRHKM